MRRSSKFHLDDAVVITFFSEHLYQLKLFKQSKQILKTIITVITIITIFKLNAQIDRVIMSVNEKNLNKIQLM